MKKLHLVLLVVALAGFVYGLLHLFRLRFEAGDSYPEYSSLRADPLGSKALYESLGSLLSARRHFRSLARLGDGPGTTVLLLGLPAEAQLAPGDFKALETFARNGGRVVISLFPSFQPRWPGAFRTVGGRRGPPTVPPMPGGTNQPPGVPPPGSRPRRHTR